MRPEPNGPGRFALRGGVKRPDPFYRSHLWKRLRADALLRDGGKCVVCREPATVVDHIVSRSNGGADTLANLRSICKLHDQQVKEDANGVRRSGGKFRILGCDAQGWPLDPKHGR